ncbi:MAG: DUF4150 domain-containing protein [Acidobacteria bacterium]|nr:DUF4150 domain-containing protein [Acidobacteriota bacterium]
MPSTTNVNFLTVVHKTSQGVTFSFPDVCKTPAPPAPPVPIPYPNIAMSSNTINGSMTVKVDGQMVLVKNGFMTPSTGDEPGSLLGIASNTVKGKAEPIMYSFDVKFEGKNVVRLMDITLHNKMSAPNTGPFPIIQPPLVVLPPIPDPSMETPKIWQIVSLDRSEQ